MLYSGDMLEMVQVGHIATTKPPSESDLGLCE